MKKILAALTAAAALLTAPFLTTSAEETIDQDSPDKSGQMNISYNSGISYIMTIPASVTFTDSEKSAERGIQVDNVFLSEGTKLKISLSSLNNFRMVNGSGYIDYNIFVNKSPLSGAAPQDILIVGAGEPSGWATLDFTTQLDKTNAQYAGIYADTLTFTVSVEPV